MTEQERQDEMERFAEVFHQFQRGLLPEHMPPRDKSEVVAIQIRAIIMHPDQSTSLAVLNGAKGPLLLEALNDPELDNVAKSEGDQEWSEDPLRRSSFDIN